MKATPKKSARAAGAHPAAATASTTVIVKPAGKRRTPLNGKPTPKPASRPARKPTQKKSFWQDPLVVTMLATLALLAIIGICWAVSDCKTEKAKEIATLKGQITTLQAQTTTPKIVVVAVTSAPAPVITAPTPPPAPAPTLARQLMPNPTVVKVLEQAGSANDMVLEMRTGRPAVIHELNARKGDGSSAHQSTLRRGPVSEKEQQLQYRINCFRARIRNTENEMAKMEDCLNESPNPGVRQSRLDSIQEYKDRIAGFQQNIERLETQSQE